MMKSPWLWSTALALYVSWTIVAVAQTAPPIVHAPVSLSIYRLHSGPDCVSGELLIDGKVVAYALERPWEGNIPIISSIPDGQYDGFIRTDTASRWRIELKAVPNRSNIQVHIGNTKADSVGCIVVGKTLSKDLCTVGESEKAYNAVKLSLAMASTNSSPSDLDVPIRVRILDYSEGAAFLDSNLSMKGLLARQNAAQLDASQSNVATLWKLNKGTRDSNGHLSVADIQTFARRRSDVSQPLLRNLDASTTEVRSSLSTGLDVATLFNQPKPLNGASGIAASTQNVQSTLLDAILAASESDKPLQVTLANNSLRGPGHVPILPTGQLLLDHASDADRAMVMNIVGAINDKDSVNKVDVEKQIRSAVIGRLAAGHEEQVKLAESLMNADAVGVYSRMKAGNVAAGDAVKIGTVLIDQVAGHETAARFQAVYGAVQQFQTLSVAFKLGSLSPASLLNGYVAAASVLGALAGPSQSDNAPVLEAIGKLSQQISEMRQEMNSRFDVLERGQQTILLKLDQVLHDCETNQQVLTAEIQGVSRDLLALQNRIDTHNRQSSLLRLSTDAELMRTYAQDPSLTKEMQVPINTALVDFYLHATETSVGVDFAGNLQGKKPDDIELSKAARSTSQIEYLSGLLPDFAARLGISLPNSRLVPNPLEWERGTRAYLQTRLLFPTMRNPRYEDQLNGLEKVGMSLRDTVKTLTSAPNLEKANQTYSTMVDTSIKTTLGFVGDYEKTNGAIYVGAVPGYKFDSTGPQGCHPCAPWTYNHIPEGIPVMQLRDKVPLLTIINDPLKLAVDLKIIELRKQPKRPGSVHEEYKVSFIAKPYAGQDAPFELLLGDFDKVYIVSWPGATDGYDRIEKAMELIQKRIGEVEAYRRKDLSESFDKWIDSPEGQASISVSSMSAVQAAASVILSLAIDTDMGDLSSSSDIASLGTAESMKAFVGEILSLPISTPRMTFRDKLSIDAHAQETKLKDLTDKSGKGGAFAEIDQTILDIRAFRDLVKK